METENSQRPKSEQVRFSDSSLLSHSQTCLKMGHIRDRNFFSLVLTVLAEIFIYKMTYASRICPIFERFVTQPYA